MDKLVFERGVRVSHAYIVASMSEETRREAALRVAAAMLCESGGDRPCGECRHCRKVFSGIHPDVVNIAPGVDDKGRKRREILVDQVRFVSADAQVMPNEAGVKVYVIHDADLMNPAAQNALLKLLEEPPASAAFVLCASNPALLLPTVRSRCALLRLNADAQADEQAVQDAQALLEAAASGIALRPGDAAFRCNLVTLEDGDLPYEEKRILSHSAGSIDGPSAMAATEALLGDERFARALREARMEIHRFPAFRQIAVQHGSDISGIRFTPPHDHLGEAVGPLLPAGNERAAVFARLMALAHEILDHHPVTEARRAAGKLPANGIWFWAEGTAVELPSFREQYGMDGAVVSAVPLCHGIGVLRGLEMVEVPGATGELDTNFEGKLEATWQKLQEYDFVCLHLEAPDECTHNGDLPGKLQAIQWLDSRLIAPLLARLEEAGLDHRALVLSDHKTLTATRGHDGDPVPFLLYDLSLIHI